VTIRVRDPDAPNANGGRPVLARVDLIRGKITGPTKDRKSDRNVSTTVAARFTAANWTVEGDEIVIQYTLAGLRADEYIRVRGTNVEEAEPLPDTQGEDPWSDLWFYTNPIFLNVSK
jgi:hypothetical protein